MLQITSFSSEMVKSTYNLEILTTSICVVSSVKKKITQTIKFSLAYHKSIHKSLKFGCYCHFSIVYLMSLELVRTVWSNYICCDHIPFLVLRESEWNPGQSIPTQLAIVEW